MSATGLAGGAGAGAAGAGDAAPLARALRAQGIAVQDGFLDESGVRALAECARLRRERGEFSGARIGSDATLQRREDIRGDSICWLDLSLAASGQDFAAEVGLFEALEGLRRALNQQALLGLFELELHYAEYRAGAGYARHIDQPQGRDQRRVSLVLYLNEGWLPSDGGQLRLFLDSGEPRDIEPAGGRLVLFLTEQREHAVLPAGRTRLSLTGWFRARD